MFNTGSNPFPQPENFAGFPLPTVHTQFFGVTEGHKILPSQSQSGFVEEIDESESDSRKSAQTSAASSKPSSGSSNTIAADKVDSSRPPNSSSTPSVLGQTSTASSKPGWSSRSLSESKMNNSQPFGSLFAPSSAAPTLGQTSTASSKPFGLFGTSTTNNTFNSQPFGSLAAAQPLGQASTAASKPFSWGLGNSTANNASTSQPFSSLSAAPALGQTSTAASNPFGWSLGNSIANNATASQPFGTNMIGPQSQQQPQNAQSTSEPQQQDGQQPQTIARDSAPAYFNTLLEKGRKRAHGSDESPAFGDLPSLQLGLGDIAKRARELGGVTGQQQGATGTGTDSRACVVESLCVVGMFTDGISQTLSACSVWRES